MPSFQKVVNLEGKSAEDLYTTVAGNIKTFLDRSPIGKYTLTEDSKTKTLEAKAKMFSAKLVCSHECLTLDIQLGLLAMPFKSQLDQSIDRWIEKHFNV